jgi:Ankyrin repeats (3 copies)
MSNLNVNAIPFTPSSLKVGFACDLNSCNDVLTTPTMKPSQQQGQRKSSKHKRRKGKLDVAKESKLPINQVGPMVEKKKRTKAKPNETPQSGKHLKLKMKIKKEEKFIPSSSFSFVVNSEAHLKSPQSDMSVLSNPLSWSSRALQGHLTEQQRQEREHCRREVVKRKMLLHPLGNSGASCPITQKNIIAYKDREKPATPSTAIKVSSVPFTRSWNIRKLRDKWWNALQEKSQDYILKAEDQPRIVPISYGAKFDQSSKQTKTSDIFITNFHIENVRMDSYRNISVDSGSEISLDQNTTKDTMPYDNHEYPLYEAILNGDQIGVAQLLKEKQEELFTTVKPYQIGLSEVSHVSKMSLMTPLHLAIFLGRSIMLRTLLNDNGLMQWMSELSMEYSPFMFAIERSLTDETCLDILVRHKAIISGVIRDKFHGDSALHHACRCGIPSSTFQELLNFMARSSGKGNQIQKLLSSKNRRGQTPMHVACANGHSHLIESMLQNCSPSLLQKLLRMQDDDRNTPLLAAVQAETTDVVVTLLMWHGNYHDKGRFYAPSRESEEPVCPLVCAVSCGSLEMIHILLEFHDPNAYHLDAALQVAILKSSEFRLDFTRILIEVGANPCSIETSILMPSPLSAFCIVATQGDNEMLALLVDFYKEKFQNRRFTRRQDPQLQNQPESYFTALESAELKEYQFAINDSLINSIFEGWNLDKWECWKASLLLLQKGATIDEIGLLRWKLSILEGKLRAADESSSNFHLGYVFSCTYFHFGDPGRVANKSLIVDKRPTMCSYWANFLRRFTWMQHESDVSCAWILNQTDDLDSGEDSEDLEIVVLVAEEVRFLAHTWLISKKCAKLEAAIRFAKSSHVDTTPQIEIELDISAKQCKWLLQHIYCGSIVSGWSATFWEELFDLALIAQEYLCPSLLQECELRIVSGLVNQCFCWSCCHSRRHVDEGIVQCLCRGVVSRVSNSILPRNTLDILALSQELSDFPIDSYCLKCWNHPNSLPVTKRFSKGRDKPENRSKAQSFSQPFIVAKEIAIQSILLHFREVIQSESFKQNSMLELDFDDRESTRTDNCEIALLKFCLDSVLHSSFS